MNVRLPEWDEQPTSEHLRSSVGNVTTDERAARFGQRPATILLTGLAGAGKTTIGYSLERRLFDDGRVATVIDGQNMRLGLNRDLDFSDEGRSENLRRTVEVARLLNQAGMISICAFVAPSQEWRQRAKKAIGEDFFVVHLNTPVDVCRQRDPNMYDKADSGEIANFPGVSAPYEPPSKPDLVLPTHEWDIDTCVEKIMGLLMQRHIIG